jgi:general secretion pathway protein I
MLLRGGAISMVQGSYRQGYRIGIGRAGAMSRSRGDANGTQFRQDCPHAGVCRGPEQCRGFSLLEVLVAFVIMSLALGVLLKVFSTGLRGAALSDEYGRAAILAESKLASLGVESELVEGTAEGEFDERYRWRTSIVEVVLDEHTDNVSPPGGGSIQPLQLTVEVYWESGARRRSVELSTLRLTRDL